MRQAHQPLASLLMRPMAAVHVCFGSKADIGGSPANIRFAPKSGYRNRHVYHLRRSNSGCFAMFAAIRRASSFVSNLAANRPLAEEG
jgi:hypothetical protein